MERLTKTKEREKEFENFCSVTDCGLVCEKCFVEKIYDRLAELEDKFESGQLIELPCNVGDDVWVVDYDGDVVSYVCVGGNSSFLLLSPTVYAGKDITTPEELCNYYVDCYMEDGDDADIVIFLRNKCFKTKSQAERRLAKLKGE